MDRVTQAGRLQRPAESERSPTPVPESASPPAPPPGSPAEQQAEGAPDPRRTVEVGEGLDYPPDAVLIVRADGTIRFANGPLAGVEEEAVLGTSLFDYVRPPQHGRVRECLQRVFDGGEAIGYDLDGLRPGAADRWYQCRFAPNLRGTEVVSATVIARDITVRKRLEDELRAERDELRLRLVDLEQRLEVSAGALAWFRNILDEAGEAIFITDAETQRIADVNDTAARWLRTTREQLIGRTGEELGLEFPLVVPEEVETEFTETRDSRRPLVLNTSQHRRRDQSTFPVEVSLTAHELRGRQYVLAVARDVKRRENVERALQQSETIYRSLFEQVSDAVFLTTRHGEIVEVNNAALQLFGYDRATFCALNARDLYVNESDIRKFRDSVSRAGAVADLSIPFRSATGETFEAYLSATPRRLADGVIHGYQCLLRPVAQPVDADRTGPAAVLLVDPDDESRGTAAAALQRAGIPVLQAETLPQALDAAGERTPEIGTVLLASEATDGAPLRAIEELRKLNPDLPIVLLVEEAADRATTDRLRPSVSAIVEKPFHPLGLLQRVREALGHTD